MKASKSQLNGLFEKFNDLTILIIGDVIIGISYWLKVVSNSAVGPVPIGAVVYIEFFLCG